jgi:PBP1b-binding outer membrane lipoprotein LpoB
MNKKRKIPKLYVGKILITIVLTSYIFNGCMMMGMHTKRSSMGKNPGSNRQVNVGSLVDQVVEEAVEDLSHKDIAIQSIALWQLKSKTEGVDVEIIRQKLITRLVNLNRFRVVSRERLQKLLEEQKLSLSGTIDKERAVIIGSLVGVEGFIDGYTAIENNKFVLSLNLIETKSGVIIWAKTIER